jgi:hypothetical protein
MSTQTKYAANDRIAEGIIPVGIAAAEETLRQIARLPAPQGLEDRLYMHLKAALLREPRRWEWLSFHDLNLDWLHGSALRAAAAVAIAAIVAGGGWGVAARIQPAALQGSVQPAPLSTPGFSSAGAIRTPQTLTGPVVETPATPAAKPGKTGKTKQHQKSVVKMEAAQEK